MIFKSNERPTISKYNIEKYLKRFDRKLGLYINTEDIKVIPLSKKGYYVVSMRYKIGTTNLSFNTIIDHSSINKIKSKINKL